MFQKHRSYIQYTNPLTTLQNITSRVLASFSTVHVDDIWELTVLGQNRSIQDEVLAPMLKLNGLDLCQEEQGPNVPYLKFHSGLMWRQHFKQKMKWAPYEELLSDKYYLNIVISMVTGALDKAHTFDLFLYI